MPGTPKQQAARRHNWLMYCLGKNKNHMHAIINQQFVSAKATITDESFELAFKVIEAQEALLRSLVHRKE